MKKFFVGVHHTDWLAHIRGCVSVARLSRRKSLKAGEWMIDSAAFGDLAKKGEHRSVESYAETIDRLKGFGDLAAAASQDFICDPYVRSKTGLSVEASISQTVGRFVRLREATDAPLMPILQGWTVADYRRCLAAYGDILKPGEWVGVGSLVSRSRRAGTIRDILAEVKSLRGDLRLHGFGLGLMSLNDAAVRGLLFSADSMAWSYAARREGRDSNSLDEARRYAEAIEAKCRRESQGMLF